MTEAESILAAPTPAEWLTGALAHREDLLIDHANCEKKAASSALALMFAYPEDSRLSVTLARLAREELRHYEQVTRVMATLGVAFTRQRPGRYAQALRAELRRAEPHRKLDLLLANALIEARSAERFRLLAPHLPPPLATLYGDLAVSEARHFEQYVEFARAEAPGQWRARLAELAGREAQLVSLPERLVRFHSGPLAARAS